MTMPQVRATYTISGGIAGLYAQLTVYTDGTLKGVTNGQNETRTVEEERLRPLIDALSRPEWNEVKAVYGEIVADGIEKRVSAGGVHTTILEYPPPLPPVLLEVLGHLHELWPDLDPFGAPVEAQRPENRFCEPSRFELGTEEVAIVCQSTAHGRWLRYLSEEDDAVFAGDQIDEFDSPHGRFASVQLRLNSAIDHRFSVLLPSFQLADHQATSQVRTIGIHDVLFIGIVPPGPPHRPGQQQTITPVSLQGMARVVDPGAQIELPPELFDQRWVRSHEEDINSVEVYRPAGFAFPPSRPRPGLEFDRRGVLIASVPHPLDAGTVPRFGHWTALDRDTIEIRVAGTEPSLLRIVEVTEKVLRVQPEQQVGTCADWSAVLDREPGGVPAISVRAVCRFPDAGYTVELCRHEPQGINPRDLLLDKIVQHMEPAAQVITDVEVEYREETDADYDTVTILPGGPTIPVHIAL